MRLLIGFVGLLFLVACAGATVPLSYDVNCHIVVDSVTSTSAHGTVDCVQPTRTPVLTTTVIQFNDPDQFNTTCGHLDVQDAWLAQVQPDVTWGNCTNVPGGTYKLFIGNLAFIPPGSNGNEYRTVIKFTDLSAIPTNGTIERAYLTIKQTWCQVGNADVPAGCSGAPLTIEAHRVLSAWDERYTRWADMPVYDPVPLSTTTVNNVLGAELTLDVTQAFRGWVTGSELNNGVILIANPLPVNDYFRGRSHDTVCDPVQGCSGGQGSPPGADAPKLTVTWYN